MPDFYIKRGDRLPSIAAQLYNADGTTVNLTGATVKFRMSQKANTVAKVDATAVVTDAVNGKVAYDWAAADTDTAGDFRAEWIVTLAGKTITYPNNNWQVVRVVERA